MDNGKRVSTIYLSTYDSRSILRKPIIECLYPIKSETIAGTRWWERAKRVIAFCNHFFKVNSVMSTKHVPPPARALATLIVGFVTSFAALCVGANLFAAPPYHRAAKPIVDDQGRKRIIVDFVDDAHEAYPRELLASFNSKTDRLQPQVNALIKSYETRLGFTRSNATLATIPYSGGQPETYVPTNTITEDWAANPGWMWLSGTSMAAPHVAAAGAYVATKYNLYTPAAVEAKLRQLWRYYGTTDAAFQPIRVVHLGP